MATIYGDDFDDDIDGFSSSDIIYGYDGDDLIYGWDGHDDIFGGYGHDTLYGGYGDDDLYGDDGDDYLVGGAGHDDLFGDEGWDDLYGGSGLDYLSGGFGEDLLSGGIGRDTLAGGEGKDLFVFKRGDSGLTSSTADTISDWNASFDFIDMTTKGTRSNYREVKTDARSIATAASDADFFYGDTNVRHVFLFNPKIDRGFLISDLNADGIFETGIVLKNAGLASDMSFSFII